MSADLWQTVLSVVAGSEIAVRNLRTTTTGTEVLLLSARLPQDLEKVYQLTAEIVPSGGHKFFRYELTENMYWSVIRAAANICIHRQDDATLKTMAIAIMSDDYNGLLAHVLSNIGIDAKFSSIHTLDDRIVFYRKILWAKPDDAEVDQAIVPGLIYCYRPKERTTSIQISYSCQMLWNWLLGIKYTRVSQLLSMSSFKQLEAIFAHTEASHAA